MDEVKIKPISDKWIITLHEQLRAIRTDVPVSKTHICWRYNTLVMKHGIPKQQIFSSFIMYPTFRKWLLQRSFIKDYPKRLEITEHFYECLDLVISLELPLSHSDVKVKVELLRKVSKKISEWVFSVFYFSMDELMEDILGWEQPTSGWYSL